MFVCFSFAILNLIFNSLTDWFYNINNNKSMQIPRWNRNMRGTSKYDSITYFANNLMIIFGAYTFENICLLQTAT